MDMHTAQTIADEHRNLAKRRLKDAINAPEGAQADNLDAAVDHIVSAAILECTGVIAGWMADQSSSANP